MLGGISGPGLHGGLLLRLPCREVVRQALHAGPPTRRGAREFFQHLAALVIGADQAAGDLGLSALFAGHVRIL